MRSGTVCEPLATLATALSVTVCAWADAPTKEIIRQRAIKGNWSLKTARFCSEHLSPWPDGRSTKSHEQTRTDVFAVQVEESATPEFAVFNFRFSICTALFSFSN